MSFRYYLPQLTEEPDIQSVGGLHILTLVHDTEPKENYRFEAMNEEEAQMFKDLSTLSPSSLEHIKMLLNQYITDPKFKKQEVDCLNYVAMTQTGEDLESSIEYRRRLITCATLTPDQPFDSVRLTSLSPSSGEMVFFTPPRGVSPVGNQFHCGYGFRAKSTIYVLSKMGQYPFLDLRPLPLIKEIFDVQFVRVTTVFGSDTDLEETIGQRFSDQ